MVLPERETELASYYFVTCGEIESGINVPPADWNKNLTEEELELIEEWDRAGEWASEDYDG